MDEGPSQAFEEDVVRSAHPQDTGTLGELKWGAVFRKEREGLPLMGTTGSLQMSEFLLGLTP